MGRGIDLSLWQLGWLWLLVPLTLAGDRHPQDYFSWWVLLNVASVSHRQLTFLVVYLDEAVFYRFPRRFAAGAALLFAGFSGSMGLLLAARPLGEALLVSLGAVGAVWNGWHLLMQKFGLMRLYALRARGAASARHDRALWLGWLPLWLLAMIPPGLELIRAYRPAAEPLYAPIAALLSAVAPAALLPALALAGLTTVGWWRAEHRSNGLTCEPRLWMAVSVGLVGCAFFVFHPLEVYLALGFNHAIEYMGFVWFQQQRARDRADKKILLVLLLMIALLALLFEFGDELWLGHPLRIIGVRAEVWLYAWTVWSSLLHFWYDGFLWKMRDPNVRAPLAREI